MGGLKALDPNGLHAIFFQSQWQIVGDSVCRLVQEIFRDLAKVEEVNKTFVTLIPQMNHLKSIKHFRLISLYNAVYKLVTKIVANKIRNIMPLVISPNRCNFVLGRNGSDNIIITQEVIH